MDEVVPDGDLVLVLGLVEVFVQHLYESFLGVQLSLIVLGVDLDLILQLLCLRYSHYLPPVGQQFLLVEVHNLMFVLNFRS